MNMLDMERILKRLSIRRPIFHSEADFQHELAWEIHLGDPSLNVRLEQPFPGRSRGAIDLVVSKEFCSHAIELKYLTRQFIAIHNGEEFKLKQHSAQDLRRYDICRDIERMEEFAHGPCRTASVIALTNDPYYWQGRQNSGTIAEAFDVSEGRTVNGDLQWASHTGAGTMKSRETPISIIGSHLIGWTDYSDLGKNGHFRYTYTFLSSPESSRNAGLPVNVLCKR